jgi:hypothetical protein
MIIDTNFNFYSDASGDNPDNSSPTLKRYHKLLWSKPLQVIHDLGLRQVFRIAFFSSNHQISLLEKFVVSTCIEYYTIYSVFLNQHHSNAFLEKMTKNCTPISVFENSVNE